MARQRRALRSNPLPSWHPEDRESYRDLLAAVCGCKATAVVRIVEAYPRGHGLAFATAADFRHLGLTTRQADRLVAAFELNRFVNDQIYLRHSSPITGPDDVSNYLTAHMMHLGQESFVAILLDSRQRVIDTVEVSRGTLSSVDVHPRELFRRAIQLGAHSMLVAHNHPSGEAIPSQSDIDLTNRIVEVGELVGIPVLDSMVVGRLRGAPQVQSLRSLGLMAPQAA